MADYETLHNGYTKRAADVLREIDAGRSALAAQPKRRWGRALAVAGVVLAAAVGAGVVVARSSGQRLEGQQITGGGATNDVAVLLAEARALLGVDIVAAQERYQQVLDRDPDQVEALTYSGWLLFTGSAGASDELRTVAVDTARQQLQRAIAVDGTYPDPHCLLAVIAATYDEDPTAARGEVDQCLALDPPAQIRSLVEQFASGLPTTSG